MSDGLALYERVCESYHAVDDFRMKLLGLLPLATGAGALLLLNSKIDVGDGKTVTEARFLGAIGAFGFLITLGLFAYELHGIKKCHFLIRLGRYLEEQLKIPGQFAMRPREVAGFINEPFAASIIYPGTLASWLFLALALTSMEWAFVAAVAVFLIGLVSSVVAGRRIGERGNKEFDDQLECFLRAVNGA